MDSRLQRQRSVPAAVAAIIVPCVQAPRNGDYRRMLDEHVADGEGGDFGVSSRNVAMARPRCGGAIIVPCGQAPKNEGYGRMFDEHVDDGDDEEFGVSGYVPTARPGGGGGLVRSLWRKVVKQKRRVLSWNGSSVKDHYDPEEYVQNFDDGETAGEPENLSRSFSARYAGRRARALWEVTR